MKFQSNCNCNRLHLYVIDPNSGGYSPEPTTRVAALLSTEEQVFHMSVFV